MNRPQSHLSQQRQRAVERTPYEQGKKVFREGDQSTEAFIIEKGRVGISKIVDGKEVQLGVLEKGALFGEMAAVTGAPRMASAVALEPTILVKIPRVTILDKLERSDPFIRAMVKILITNLSEVHTHYIDFSKQDVVDSLIDELDNPKN